MKYLLIINKTIFILVAFQVSAVIASSNQSLRLRSFINKLNSCEILDYTSHGIIGVMSKTIRTLNDFYKVYPREGAFYTYIPSYELKNETEIFESEETFPIRWPIYKRIRSKVDNIKKNVGSGISFDEIISAANKRFEVLKEEKVIGECYYIAHGNYGLDELMIVNLNLSQQSEIDNLFDTKILESEKNKFPNGYGYKDVEYFELRAIRIATRYFEQFTVLKHDTGGYWGNLDVFSDIITKCRNESFTYWYFLNVLKSRNLLKYFLPVQKRITRSSLGGLDGHLANLLADSHDFYIVLDSWHKDGGNAANINSIEDWRAGLDDLNIVDIE